jgi:hypothetical protein
MGRARHCGDCQLCCRLLPVVPLQKGADEKCGFQKVHKGCTVYATPQMPPECKLWNCRWLLNDDTGEIARPDKAHYVIDVMPDFITVGELPGLGRQHIPVVQIWIDPNYPDIHRDPALRAYLWRRASEGIAALIRFNSRDAIVLFAPPMTNGEWHEVHCASPEKTHSVADIVNVLGAWGGHPGQH